MTQPERQLAATEALLEYLREHNHFGDSILKELEANTTAAITDTP
jgi:hypothetical protein